VHNQCYSLVCKESLWLAHHNVFWNIGHSPKKKGVETLASLWPTFIDYESSLLTKLWDKAWCYQEHLGEPVRKFIENLWEHDESTKTQKHWTHTSYMVPPLPLPLSSVLGREVFRLLCLGVSHVPKILTVSQWNGSLWQMKLRAQPLTNRSTNKYSQFIMGVWFLCPNIFPKFPMCSLQNFHIYKL
jgi:hypothetical protein